MSPANKMSHEMQVELCVRIYKLSLSKNQRRYELFTAFAWCNKRYMETL